VGEAIGSAALVADGHHARIDGLTSLAVLLGAIGARLGYPIADPIVGILITVVILHIAWHSARGVLIRLLDGVEPSVLDKIRHAIQSTAEVKEVTQVRVRWLGHRLVAEMNLAVDPNLTVEQAHEIANRVRHELLHHVRFLSNATIHVDPATASGEEHHHIEEHSHGDHPAHSHRIH
jgi:cation diffusion facilitator family transporter